MHIPGPPLLTIGSLRLDETCLSKDPSNPCEDPLGSFGRFVEESTP